jgi:hypothetical protein
MEYSTRRVLTLIKGETAKIEKDVGVTYHMPRRQQQHQEADAHENRLPRPLRVATPIKHDEHTRTLVINWL